MDVFRLTTPDPAHPSSAAIRRRGPARLMLGASMVLGLFGCTEPTVPEFPDDGPGLTVSPSRTVLGVDSTATLVAVVRDEQGHVLNGLTKLWTSSDTSVVGVTSTGLIQAVAPGQATVTATVDTLSGSAIVVVGTAVSTVDFGAPVSNPRSMSGLLHGFNFDGPPYPDFAKILPLRPPIWRATPDNVPIDIARQVGARYNLILSDFWGYPNEGWPNGRPYEHPDEYVAMMRQIAAQYRGQVDIWEIWNEPDFLPYSWDGTEAQFFETYSLAYEALREVLGPSAKIEGPSFSRFDSGYLRRFADYCVANGCQVNVLSWHEMGLDRPLSVIADHVATTRSAYMGPGRYAALGISEIHVNESVGPPETYDPAGSLTFLQYLERGGADAAARACWGNDCVNNSLDGLLTAAGEPRAVWWAYSMYADGAGTRVASTLSDGRILTLGSSSSVSSGRPNVLLGYSRTGDDSLPLEMDLGLKLAGLNRLAPVAGADTIRIVIEEVPALEGAPLLAPRVFLDTVVPVSGAAAVIPVAGVKANAVYRLTVRKD
jgi:xylan 1,4-beta-xylosidase